MTTIYNGLKSKVVVTVPSFKDDEEGTKVVCSTRTAFDKIPLIFRAMNIRADNLVRVPFTFLQDGKEVDQYPFEEDLPFRDFLREAEMALMATGRSFILTLEKEYEGIRLAGAGLQWLNPFSIEVNLDRERNGERKLVFNQWINGIRYPRYGSWTEEEMYYIREFGFGSTTSAGTYPLAVALGDANAMHSLSFLLGKFFESGGIPPIIVSAAKDTGELPKKELKKWFKKQLTGLRKWKERILVIDDEVKVDPLSSELKEFDIEAVDSHIVTNIASAFGMSPTSLVAGSANRATAEVEDVHLMRTIEARAALHEIKYNRFFSKFGSQIKARVQELPEFQEDEEQRSTALLNLVNAGEDLLRAYEILGYHINEEHRKELEEKHRIKIERALNPSNPPQQQSQLLPSNGNAQFKMELRKWMRKAIERFKEGKSAAMKFATDIIPEEEQKRIILALSNVDNVEEIKAVFTSVEKYYEFSKDCRR